MIDFSILQIHAINQCNYLCKACSAFSSILPERIYQAEEYIEVLDKLQTYCSISTIHIMGGEPTLHPNLVEFISKIRKHTTAKIDLITNGWWLSNYEKYDELLKVIDILDFSPHPENKLTSEEQHYILSRVWAKNLHIFA
jgi:molybdenum cofactor biosynthesis enzyme MoaA